MNKFDVIVVGGGLLGCFAARNLMRYPLSVALLEQREDVCTGISKANTAIVYSGSDTKPGTLKTELCVRANSNFEKLCSDLGVRFSRCGSIMVCFGEKGEAVLRQKFAQGQLNGVPGLKLISGEEVLKMEPSLDKKVRMGLYCPTAGTVDPWELCLAAYENARANGCETFLNSRVTQIVPQDGGYVVITEKDRYFTRGIINCAGMFSDEVMEMVSPPSVRVFPERGDYYVLDTKAQGCINHVIFHEPEEKGKGLTLVPTVDGNILIGPTELPGGDKYTYFTQEDGLRMLRSWCRTVAPSLPLEHIIRNFGALRPMPFYMEPDENGDLVKSGRSISNFLVMETADNPAFLSLVGIKTPGLTCADELGRHVANKLAELLGAGKEKPSFSPLHKRPVAVSELSDSERSALIKAEPDYGRIVCRCRGISEGEIRDAIQRGAVTVDGVKRRTGATMGRCQGGFCTQRISELLAQQLSIPLSSVTKDGGNSYIYGGDGND